MMLITILSLVILWWLIATFVLSGPDLSRFDTPVGEHFDKHADDEKYTEKFLQIVHGVRATTSASRSLKKGIAIVRDFADNLSSELETDTVFTADSANGVSIEWAVARGVSTKRRVLFLHGGAFLFGSAKGHRKFSDRLSKLANAAVCSVNYRMLPEHGRMKSIADAQVAYNWLLEYGPDGKQDLEFLLVSGDSAGGNLALMLSSWSKESIARRPDVVVAFSPSTDMTLSSPTIKSNQATDKMLGEGLGLLSKFPAPFRAWIGLFSLRMNPANKLASPVFGDLSDLPPTLIQASSNEMLLGENIRYTNRANAVGSDVKLQVWEDQMHDWHLFNMGHGSAETAWQEVKFFLDSV